MKQVFTAGVAAVAIMTISAQPALAGDKPLVAATPDWIAPAPELSVKDAPHSGNAVLRFDEQVLVDGDQTTSYIDTAAYIDSAEMLNAMGTLSIPWQPAHGDLIFIKVEILRGDQRIDVLKDGSGLTVLRREAGLERLMVDGTLTAVLHIEDLRVGDVLRLVIANTQNDKLLGGFVQSQLVLLPKPMRAGFARARLVWSASQHLAWKAMMPGINATPTLIVGGREELVIPLPVDKLIEVPKDIPARFKPLPLVMVSSFTGWDQVASVMAPLYKTDGAIAEGSDLAKAVDAIAARTKNPVERMAAALQMVQDDVRYQLIALGTGNYEPQRPADTWQKRYGDCKAKTLLLLSILRRLGIEAEPVMANSSMGDLVGEMLPAAQAFDHVFVHAKVAGEDYWLDGTNLGSRLADIHDVPRFGKVLPIRGTGAALIDLPRRANARPEVDVTIAYDQSAGPHLPVPYTLTLRYAGPTQEGIRIDDNGVFDERLQAYVEAAASSWTDSSLIGKPVAVYDRTAATWTVTVDGVAFPTWTYRDGRYERSLAPELRVTFDADRGRTAWRQMPALIDHPWTANVHMTMLLPRDGLAIDAEGLDPVKVSHPSATWERSVKIQGRQLSEEIAVRETGAEVPAADISATGKSINDAMGKNTVIRLPADYPLRWNDVVRQRGSAPMKRVLAVLDQRIALKPEEADRRDDRGWFEAQMLDFAGAEADYTKALALDATAARYLLREGIRSKRGDKVGALADAQAAYDLESGNKEARKALALDLAQSGKIDDALALLDPNPDLSTDDGQVALMTRVEILDDGGRHDEAMALLDAALLKRPSSAELRNGRCWFSALRDRNLDGALTDCNRAIELTAKPAGYLDSRALVNFRAGRMDQAKSDLDAALAIDPEIPSSLFLRGIVLGRLGQKAAGDADIAAARKLYPGIDQDRARYGLHP
jgi:tetratricopeptide (TPR) repeat protein